MVLWHMQPSLPLVFFLMSSHNARQMKSVRLLFPVLEGNNLANLQELVSTPIFLTAKL